MNKDSAVPERESLPDGKNADAASYIKDSTRSKDPLYGPISGETNTGNARPDSDGTTPPRAPAEPAARNNEDDKAFIRRMVDFANESRENRKLYWRKDGQRNNLDDRVDGRGFPQLKPGPRLPRRRGQVHRRQRCSASPSSPTTCPKRLIPLSTWAATRAASGPTELGDLDAETNDREWTLQADRMAEAAKLKAKEDHGENSEEYKAVKRVYSDTHSAVRDIGESHGENAALHHAIASQHPEYVLVDVPRTGNGSDQFDQSMRTRTIPAITSW